jgi:hypothetical protein
LWGDVPALMPIVKPREGKPREGTKNNGGSWFNIGSPGQKVTNRNPVHGEGRKVPGFRFDGSGRSFQSAMVEVTNNHEGVKQRGSKGKARQAASAAIAKIPLVLARHVARAWFPVERQRAA